MEDYSSSFTVHGLNWICTSGNIMEKMFWAIAMLGVIGFALFMVHGYIKRYLSFDLRTEIRNIESPILPLPTMLFCFPKTKFRRLGCYQGVNLFRGKSCNISEAQSTELTYHNFTTGETKFAKYIGDGCHVVNENGSLSWTGAGSTMELKIKAPSSHSKVDFTAISTEEYKSRKEKVLYVERIPLSLKRGYYDLSILQTDYIRLPHPYATNCTNQNLSPNPFSVLYSRTTCMQSCLMRIWLSECGDVPDIMQRYIIKGTHPFSNTSQKDRRKCMGKAWTKMNTLFCSCPLACHQKKYEPVIKMTKPHNKTDWSITIVNEDSKITKIIEVPDYTLEDCLGAVGGILGLAIGASSLSVVELVVYLGLFLVKKMY